MNALKTVAGAVIGWVVGYVLFRIAVRATFSQNQGRSMLFNDLNDFDWGQVVIIAVCTIIGAIAGAAESLAVRTPTKD